MVEQVRETLADVLGVAATQVPADASTGTFGDWDSMVHLNLMLTLEERFGVSLPPEEIAELTNLTGIAEKLAASRVASS